MDTDLATEEVLQPQPRELSGESLLTTEYLGVRVKHYSHTAPFTLHPYVKHLSLCKGVNTLLSVGFPLCGYR